MTNLSRKLGIETGARPRPDGRFTLSTVECLGSCWYRAGGDGQRGLPREHERVTRLDALIEELGK